MNIEKMDQLLCEYINDFPILINSKELFKKYLGVFEHNLNLDQFNDQLIRGYSEFEDWLDSLFMHELYEDTIRAFNFGLFESEGQIQLYLSGSSEWDHQNDDWASNNDYFPEVRYPSIKIYQYLNDLMKENYYLGLFATISTTIIYANSYITAKPSNFPIDVTLATGFDDGDLYNFCKRDNEQFNTVLN